MITHKSDAKLSRGWTAFARANSLQAGDICSFHLINSEHIAFEVTIIRGPDQVVYDSSKLNQGSGPQFFPLLFVCKLIPQFQLSGV